MKKTIDLSVIIVSFNNRELLKNCLNSVYEHISSKLTYEVFVVDNNSADGSLQLVQEYFPQVFVIDNQENKGFAAANNQALVRARGRYVVLLNNDTFVLGNCFERLVTFMDQNPKIGAVSPKLLNGDGLTTQLQGRTKKEWLSAQPIPVKFITGACFMIRRETYKNVGGLDEHFFFYNEDLDWCKRILSYGWEIYYYPESAVIHYGGKSTGHISYRAIVEGIKGGLYFCRKHYRFVYPLYAILLLFLLLACLMGNILKIILFYDMRQSIDRIKAYSQLIVILLVGKL